MAVVERAADELVRATGVEAGLILLHAAAFQRGTESRDGAAGGAVSREPGGGAGYCGGRGGVSCWMRMWGLTGLRGSMGWHGRHMRARRAGRRACGRRCGCLIRSGSGMGCGAYEDARLVEHLKREGIHLEVCPSSNVQIVPEIARWEDHPVDRLYRAGVRLNVNTDTRMLNPVTLSGEYEGMARVFGWGFGGFSHDEFDGGGGGVCFGWSEGDFEEEGGGGVWGNRIVTRVS